MELILYSNFLKRKNSTKQPTGGVVYDVKTKQGCSIERPVFLIDGVNLAVNYAKWNNAYYFIDDIILSLNNIYELHCSMDVLATYKSAIGGYTTYIERSESAIDDMINDPLLSAKQEILALHQVRAGRPFPATTTGCFVVEVMNDEGIVLYACTSLEPFKIICQPSTYSAQNIIDWIDSKISQAFDLDVYVGSVKWMPLNPASIGTLTNTLKVGPIELTDAGFSLYQVNQTHIVSAAHDLTLPANLNYSDWRMCNPRFTTYDIYLPGVGQVRLDSNMLGSMIKHSNTFGIRSDLDCVSGEVAYQLECNVSGVVNVFDRYYGNMSVNVPIGKSVSDLGETAKTSITTIGGMAGAGAMAGGGYGAAAGAIVGGISVIDNIFTPRIQMTGGGGNKASLLAHQQYEFLVTEYASKDYPTYNAGRPLCEYRQISSLSGYIKCGGASLDSIACGPEKDEINNLLNSGFYYE